MKPQRRVHVSQGMTHQRSRCPLRRATPISGHDPRISVYIRQLFLEHLPAAEGEKPLLEKAMTAVTSRH